nr:MAG TPA: hypothetical protein [Caudoviricetes sp.]DAY80173.1 MAG TPA: hypothetical protein [Caudoviricetes sp.]
MCAREAEKMPCEVQILTRSNMPPSSCRRRGRKDQY